MNDSTDWSGSLALDRMGTAPTRDSQICYRIEWSGSFALDLWAHDYVTRQSLLDQAPWLSVFVDIGTDFRTGQPVL